MPQITARLPPQARRQFEKYAVSLGLNGSSLARLLLLRQLWGPVKGPSPGVGRKQGSEDRKLTAHSCSAETVKRLRIYAKARRISPAEAAKLIFERELRERWLARAMGLNRLPERPRKG